MSRNALKALAATIHDWHPPAISEDILCGDMPGDKVQIEEGHVEKANTIFPILVPMAAERAKNGRVVIAVCGGSGVGKSEIASLLSHYFRCAGIDSLCLATTIPGEFLCIMMRSVSVFFGRSDCGNWWMQANIPSRRKRPFLTCGEWSRTQIRS